MKKRIILPAAAAVGLAALVWSCTRPESPPSPAPAPAPAPAKAGEPAKHVLSGVEGPPAPANGGAFAPAVEAKPLSDPVKKGIAWLLARQHENGGFSQGEESAQMGNAMESLRDKPNVADTCVAALALIRAGSTPASGPQAREIARALGFVMSEVEAADEKSLFVTSIRGTRVQMKLGPYVDTFLASMLLAEARGKMPDEAGNKRVAAALDKVMDKIEKNQRSDGTWDSRGWAPVLSQGLAGKALVRAKAAGVEVNQTTILNAEKYSEGQLDPSAAGGFKGDGAAGVSLYSASANLGVISENGKTLDEKERIVAYALAKTPASSPEHARLLGEQREIETSRRAQESAEKSVTGQLENPQFLSGFGSNGGEEFLSYMNISESLVVKGGPEWEKWDKSMAQNLGRIQNEDGSWTGHHCITGRTFCTAAALLVLTADRAPFPVAARVARR